jgi:solute carrier family 25 folate transporter 32
MVSLLTNVDGLYSIAMTEGYRGLWKGSLLALIGVTNGAVQFMAYEQMKRWGFARKKRKIEKSGRTWSPLDDRLVDAS